MNERTTGYILLISGILIILFSALSLVSVFTKRSEPIQLFHLQAIAIDSSALTPQMPDLSSVPGMNIPQKKQVAKSIEILPAETLNNSANIFAHLALMGFLVSVGGNIATLGTNLLRPIIVKTPQNTLETEMQS